MRGPHRFVLRMALFLAIVVAIAVVLGPSLLNAFLRNPAFNGLILGLLIAGIAYIFRQVLLLEPASDWIDDFRERLANRDLTAPPGPAPRMLGADGAHARAAGRAAGSACRRPRCRRCSTASPRGSTRRARPRAI